MPLLQLEESVLRSDMGKNERLTELSIELPDLLYQQVLIEVTLLQQLLTPPTKYNLSR